jgi:hypothetical protein
MTIPTAGSHASVTIQASVARGERRSRTIHADRPATQTASTIVRTVQSVLIEADSPRQRTAISSISKTSVAPGGITGGKPRAP